MFREDHFTAELIGFLGDGASDLVQLDLVILIVYSNLTMAFFF